MMEILGTIFKYSLVSDVLFIDWMSNSKYELMSVRKKLLVESGALRRLEMTYISGS